MTSKKDKSTFVLTVAKKLSMMVVNVIILCLPLFLPPVGGSITRQDYEFHLAAVMQYFPDSMKDIVRVLLPPS